MSANQPHPEITPAQAPLSPPAVSPWPSPAVPGPPGWQAPPAQPRHWLKTAAVSLLLLLVPFVGGSISLIYIYDRDNPARFSFGRAFVATVLQFVYLAALAALIIAVLAATGLIGQVVQDARFVR